MRVGMISSRYRRRSKARGRLLGACLQMVGLAGLSMAQTSGTWTNATSGGAWSESDNWLDGIVADGAGATGLFNSIDITTDNTVHLDAPRTIGNLTFGDTATNTPAGWILDNNGSALNILTLAGTTPTITVNALGTNVWDRSATISAEIAGSGGLIKAGVGVLTLSASNTFSGTTTVTNKGILAISNPSALGSTSGGTTVADGQLRLIGGITVAGEALTLRGNYSDAMGRGALRSHSGSNVWAGPITLAAGAETWINASGGPLTLTGGIIGTNRSLRLDQGQQIVTDNPIILASGTLSINSVTRLAVAGNTFGTLRVDWGGDLRTEVADAVPANTLLILGASGSGSSSAGRGTVNLSGNDLTVARLTDGGTNYLNELVHNSSGTAARLTINQSVNTNYLGRIAGNLALIKQGAGTLTLGGSNSYSGATTVSNGILRVNGLHLGGGLYTVASGATLGGTGLISAALYSVSGGVVAPGNAIGTLTFNGNADLDGVLKIELDSSGFGSSDVLSVTGTLDISAATLDFDLLGEALDDDAYVFAEYGALVGTFADILDAPGGYLINYAYNGNQIALVIPEPATLSLLLIGALGLMLHARRKKSAR